MVDTGDPEVNLEDLFRRLRVSSEPLHNIDEFRTRTLYSSSIVTTENGDKVGIGFGYKAESSGRRFYKAQGSGKWYDMSNGSPQKCFNCIDREDMSNDEKYHWRVDCRLSRGNNSLYNLAD